MHQLLLASGKSIPVCMTKGAIGVLSGHFPKLKQMLMEMQRLKNDIN